MRADTIVISKLHKERETLNFSTFNTYNARLQNRVKYVESIYSLQTHTYIWWQLTGYNFELQIEFYNYLWNCLKFEATDNKIQVYKAVVAEIEVFAAGKRYAIIIIFYFKVLNNYYEMSRNFQRNSFWLLFLD